MEGDLQSTLLIKSQEPILLDRICKEFPSSASKQTKNQATIPTLLNFEGEKATATTLP